MDISEIKKQLKKSATVYKPKCIEPTKELGESWIGKVTWQKNGETQPIDSKGNLMTPIATFFIDSTKPVPKELSKFKLITVFMSEEIWDNLINVELGNYFVIRTYESLDDLVECNYTAQTINPVALIPDEIDNEFPKWDDGGIPDDLFDIIWDMEKKDGVEYYNDIFEKNEAQHKLGGYPSFCQSGYWFGDEYKYVMQISSDSKAQFNIVDSGNFYFYYNPDINEWKVYCDFY